MTGYTTYYACHDDNSYVRPWKSPCNISVAGSRGYDVIRDCDLIINADKPMVGVSVTPPLPPRPILTFSTPEQWGDLEQYIYVPSSTPKKLKKTPEIIDIAWPDMGIPNLTAAFWVKLWEMIFARSTASLEANPECEYEVLFTCMGGHGRTGTAMSCFLVGSGSYDPLSAIKWVRHEYCDKAVESESQEKYLWQVGAAILKKEGHEQAKIDDLKKDYEKWCLKNFKSTGSTPVSGIQVYNKETGKWEVKGKKDMEDEYGMLFGV